MNCLVDAWNGGVYPILHLPNCRLGFRAGRVRLQCARRQTSEERRQRLFPFCKAFRFRHRRVGLNGLEKRIERRGCRPSKVAAIARLDIEAGEIEWTIRGLRADSIFNLPKAE